MEEWKSSKKYSDYELSTEGKVRNTKTGRVLKTRTNDKGYEIVSLRKDNKTCTERVHKLMADAFIDDIPEGYDVYHENLDRSDNRLENLKYCTKSETCKRGFREGNRKGRGQIRVQAIETDRNGVERVVGEFESIRECARALGLNQSQICKCLNGVAYKAGKYTFRKVE